MPAGPPSRNAVVRSVWLVAGLLLAALGAVGAVVPLLPTTIFLILAAGCFARSSPALEARILGHPRVGPLVLDWRARGAIPPRAKMLAVGGLAGGYAVFLVAAQPPLPAAILLAAVMALIAAWILGRPS